MQYAEALCVFLGFILYNSGVHGQQANSICALKGSSLVLPCSAEYSTSTMQWYTVHRNGSTYDHDEISANGVRVLHISEESNYTLTINDLKESDAKSYCCRETGDPELCWHNSTELHVADLQVKVLPSSEGHTVTLMCSTSCPLSENPVVYMWYKNRAFLYEDWSPWYQQLVSSEEAATYSCAVRGYEHLRAPDVSVDSVTASCFTVTYAKGKMCSDKQKSEDKPCTITYPTEVYVQRTVEEYVTLTCATKCLLTDPQTAYRWYWNRHLYSSCESQDVTVFTPSSESASCAVKGHEDLHSDEYCVNDMKCFSVNYVSRRICALEGTSVNISCKYWVPAVRSSTQKSWNKAKSRDEEAEEVIKAAGRVEYHDNIKSHILALHNLMRNDSAEYTFRLHKGRIPRQSNLSRVTLIVTGLKVTMSPSSVVSEGQRVTVSCSTSCPLPDNTDYSWYLNGRPLTLTESPNKHLLLDPVSSHHAGNYSCAVESSQNVSSYERTLTVTPRAKSVMIGNAVKLTLLLLIPPAAFLLYLKMRKKKTLPSTTELNDKVLTEQVDSVYESIALTATTPPARKDCTV